MATTRPNAKRLVRSKSGLKKIPLNDYERSPFELTEPEWIPDKESPSCMGCNHKFDFLKRRHHCRRCGKLVCGGCCEARMALPRMCFLDPVRLCGPCAETTLKERHFYDYELKTLIAGASLNVSYLNDDDCLEEALAHCRLSPDHRQLFIAGSKWQSIPMHRIVAMNTTATVEDDSGGGSISSVHLQAEMKGDDSDLIEVTLKSPLETLTTASAFLLALQSAICMVKEARAIIGTGE